VVPHNLFVGGNLGNSKLVGKQDVPVAEDYRITDFSLGCLIGVRPFNLAVAYPVHILDLGFSGIEEVKTRQPVSWKLNWRQPRCFSAGGCCVAGSFRGFLLGHLLEFHASGSQNEGADSGKGVYFFGLGNISIVVVLDPDAA